MIESALPDRHMDMLARERTAFVKSLSVGEFVGKFRLEWLGPGRWRYWPDHVDPFAFRRASGQVIIPEDMTTDGGSVPRLFWPLPGLSPWDYGPAFMLHDWEFFAHDQGMKTQTFEEVNLTLAEAIKTLMVMGFKGTTVRYNAHALLTIHQAVSSPIGRKIWDDPA